MAVTVQGADQGDTTRIDQTLADTVEQLITVEKTSEDPIEIASEIVADKGYHSRDKIRELTDVGFRTYISEPDRPPQGWIDQRAERDAVYANRRRIQGARGQRLLRKRGELLECPNAHLYDTGGIVARICTGTITFASDRSCMRAPAILDLWMHIVCGAGTPRGLQGRVAALIVWALIEFLKVLRPGDIKREPVRRHVGTATN